ncbi:MAG: Molybdenum transporter permease subunit [Chloroflexi bacterium]|nr:Molybdenum transporter permease subunit [Chloroflexota bacterium]
MNQPGSKPENRLQEAQNQLQSINTPPGDIIAFPTKRLADYPPGQARRKLQPAVFWLLISGLAMILFLVVPLLALVLRSVISGSLGLFLTRPAVVEALRLSLVTTGCTLLIAIVFGTPLAYLLARFRFPGHRAIDTLLDLPMVLPPAVAGIALLITFGRRGWVGQWLDQQFGITIGFTSLAVVLAQVFVAAPFYIKAAKAGFESVDTNLETVAASLGSGGLRTFRRVTVPLALPALLGGMVMTWARALGEFGATIMFAGNFEGTTQTMPLAIYASLEGSGGLDEAVTLSVILVVVSFAVLILFKFLARYSTIGWHEDLLAVPPSTKIVKD